MKKLVVLLLVSLMATSAFAVVDPDDDMIGIYFDMNADDNCLIIGASLPFMAYIVTTNPTAPAISAYELGYRIVVPTGMEGFLFRLASTIANGVTTGLNLGNETDVLEGTYIVGLAEGLPGDPATVLHSWQFMLLSPLVTMEFYLSSIPVDPSIPGDYPVLLNDVTKVLYQAGQSTGGPDTPVATVNFENCVVGVENASFGSVKSLFR